MSQEIEPGSIVVAVDGSEHSARALNWAAEQASLERRPLLVVVTTDAGQIRVPGWAGTAEGDRASAMRLLLATARAVADDAAETARSLRPGITVDVLPAVGDPRGILIDLSKNARLIVMGSRGRGTVRSMLLGSVSAAVSKHAACPVVVCRPPRGRGTPRGVVVGSDGTPESVPVIEFAFEQASLRDLPLTVLHCFWDVVAASAGIRRASADDLDPADREQLRAILAESVAGLTEKYPDVPVTLEVTHGLVDQTIAGPSAHWELVVVGRHPLNSLGRVLTGSISTAIVERAHVTVAVVPEAETPVEAS